MVFRHLHLVLLVTSLDLLNVPYDKYVQNHLA